MYCRSASSHKIVIGSSVALPTRYPHGEVIWGLSDVSEFSSFDSSSSELNSPRTDDSVAKFPRLFQSYMDDDECQLVNLTCSQQQCGIRPRYHNADPTIPEDVDAEGQWPWHVSLHREGDFVCAATLISEQWLVASSNCARHFE